MQKFSVIDIRPKRVLCVTKQELFELLSFNPSINISDQDKKAAQKFDKDENVGVLIGNLRLLSLNKVTPIIIPSIVTFINIDTFHKSYRILK